MLFRSSGLDSAGFLDRYGSSIKRLQELQFKGLSGSGYFDLVDVEGEEQGFLTYDREVAKIPVEDVARLNEAILPRAGNYADATAGFVVREADARSEKSRYSVLVSAFSNGNRDVEFLQRLAGMATRQKDYDLARKAGNAFVSLSHQPYSDKTWAAIASIAHSSGDQAYQALRSNTNAANASLGPGAAEKKLADIIRRELFPGGLPVEPSSADTETLEAEAMNKYGPLGQEVIIGATMMKIGRAHV